jgi:hypothetical protein
MQQMGHNIYGMRIKLHFTLFKTNVNSIYFLKHKIINNVLNLFFPLIIKKWIKTLLRIFELESSTLLFIVNKNYNTSV